MLVLALSVVLVFLSGFVLTRRGSPYNTVVVTVHKLVALGSVVLLTLAFTTGQVTAPEAWYVWALAGLTGATVLSLFASGALLSGSRSPSPPLRRIHRVVPYLALAAGLALMLLTT
jgi:hypothetical protein